MRLIYIKNWNLDEAITENPIQPKRDMAKNVSKNFREPPLHHFARNNSCYHFSSPGILSSFFRVFFSFLKIYSVIDMLFHFLPNFKTLFIEMLSTGYLNIPCSVEFFKYTYHYLLFKSNIRHQYLPCVVDQQDFGSHLLMFNLN